MLALWCCWRGTGPPGSRADAQENVGRLRGAGRGGVSSVRRNVFSEIVVVAPRESTAVSRCGLHHLVTPGVGQIETLRLLVFLKRETSKSTSPH